MRRSLATVAALFAFLAVSVAPAAGTQDPPPLSPPFAFGAENPPAGWPAAPTLTAASFVLVDAGTGQVLAAGSADERRPVASTVKILTALTALRRTALDVEVTAGDELARVRNGAAVGLEPGETWTVEDLLEAVVARSGNDAAAALAAHVAGSEDDFVELMRADAAALGLTGIELHEPDGLSDRNRLSAHDLVVLARAALQVPELVEIAARPDVELPDLGRIESRNELLGSFDGADGMKTGYTSAAGRCLVATATREGRRLLAVVLGSSGEQDHFRDAAALLEFGFGTFAPLPAGGRDAMIRVPGSWVAPAAVVDSVLVPRGGDGATLVFAPPVEADGASSLAVSFRGGELGEVPLDWSGTPAGDEESVGSWLTGRAYAAMRAATATGAWPTAEEGA